MNAPVILSLGSINVDFQVRIDRRPEPGETVLGRDLARLGGGKAANVAFLARRLEAGAELLARVGDDDLREHALAPLREIGVDVSHVSAVKGGVTGASLIAVPPDGKRLIILAANANQCWTREDTDEIAAAVESAAAGSVLVVDYEVPGFVVEQAVDAASRCRLPVILDPSPADRVEQCVLSRIDVIVPNASEASELTGIVVEDVEAASTAGRMLVERGVKAACLKLPGGGCVLAQQQRTFHIPPLPVEVRDATGAGDAFAGALAVALLEQRPLLEAACFATAASHLAITHYGSQPAYPTRDQLCDIFQGLISRAYVLKQHL